MKLSALLIALLCVGSFAHANVYTCTIDGAKVYTNKRGAGCHEERLDKIGSYSSDKTVKQRAQNFAAAPSSVPTQAAPSNTASSKQAALPPASRPVKAASPTTATPVSHLTSRDQGRREILLGELANEKKALAQARVALTNGRLIQKPSDARKQQSLVSLQRAVADRQQNIQALQNELARM